MYYVLSLLWGRLRFTFEPLYWELCWWQPQTFQYLSSNVFCLYYICLLNQTTNSIPLRISDLIWSYLTIFPKNLILSPLLLLSITTHYYALLHIWNPLYPLMCGFLLIYVSYVIQCVHVMIHVVHIVACYPAFHFLCLGIRITLNWNLTE